MSGKCEGVTQKGKHCKRNALENGYCKTHVDQATSASPPRKRSRTVEKIPPAKRQKLSKKEEKSPEPVEAAEEKTDSETSKTNPKRTVEAPPSHKPTRTVEPPPKSPAKVAPKSEVKSSAPEKNKSAETSAKSNPKEESKSDRSPDSSRKKRESTSKRQKSDSKRESTSKRGRRSKRKDSFGRTRERSRKREDSGTRERSRSRKKEDSATQERSPSGKREEEKPETNEKKSKVDISIDDEPVIIKEKARKKDDSPRKQAKRKRRRFTERPHGDMSISAERSVSADRKKKRNKHKVKTEGKKLNVKEEKIKVKKEDTSFFDFSGAEEGFSGAESSDGPKDYTNPKVREAENEERQKYRSGSLSPPPPTQYLGWRKVKNEKPMTGPAMPSGRKLPKQSRFKSISDLPLTIPKRESDHPVKKRVNVKALQNSIEAQLKGLDSMFDVQVKDEKFSALEELKEPVLKIEERVDPGLYDPRVKVKGRRSRKGKALNFFKKGTIPSKGERLDRLLSRQFIHKQPSAVAAAYLDDTFNYVSDEEIPGAEWWDKPYCGESYETEKLNVELITSYVNHPAALDDLGKSSDTKQLPLFLTSREKGKIRRKKTKDKHDAMIDAIRLGLQEPPEPKLKLSSIVRVLGSQFIADPSAAEAKARAQMDFRKMKHNLHNEQRKLTVSQRSEKKKKKLQEDTSQIVHTAVFRIYNLDDSQIRWKITVNAKQYNLTGCMMVHKKMSMVMVEGGPKGIRKYTALMTRRIRWKQQDHDMNKSPCALVWQGVTGKRVFSEFVIETFEQESDIIKYLDQKTVLGYWKQCKEHQAIEKIDADEDL